MPVIEKRYAEALSLKCEDSNNFDEILKIFTDFIEIFKKNNDFKSFLTNPIIDIIIKKETLAKIFESKNEEYIQNLIFTLLDKHRISIITKVYDEFVKIANIKKDILKIKIFSAKEIEQEQIDKLSEIYLVKFNKKSVKTEIIIDPSLIGGLKIQIGDLVIDSTLKSRLNELAKLTEASIN